MKHYASGRKLKAPNIPEMLFKIVPFLSANGRHSWELEWTGGREFKSNRIQQVSGNSSVAEPSILDQTWDGGREGENPGKREKKEAHLTLASQRRTGFLGLKSTQIWIMLIRVETQQQKERVRKGIFCLHFCIQRQCIICVILWAEDLWFMSLLPGNISRKRSTKA